MRPVIAIEVAFHSEIQPLARAVASALSQRVPGFEIRILILDSSRNGCAEQLLRGLKDNRRSCVIRSDARVAFVARNRLLRNAERRWPNLAWHVRLDADDCFTSKKSLRAVFEEVKPSHRIILGGNRQIGPEAKKYGLNIPTSILLKRGSVLARLSGMAQGNLKDELPSCNLILRAGFGWKYPSRKSAEDHWLLARLLLQLKPQQIHICQLELVDYSVGGGVTQVNKTKGVYLTHRKALLEAAIGWNRRG